MNGDIILTNSADTLRVRLVQDVDAPMPNDECGGFVYDVTRGVYHWYADDTATGKGTPPDLSDALDRWGGDWDRLERYLRIFHDVVSLAWYDKRNGDRYLMVVTRTQAEEWGTSEDAWGTLANLSEWEAWDEGDVYGYVVEQLAEWEAVSSPLGLACTEMHTWEHVDSCWGFYGHQYASQAAVEALASTVEDAEGDR